MHVRALASSRSTVRKHRGFMVPSGPVTRPCSAEEPEQKLPGGHSAARSLAAPTLLPGRGSKRLNLDFHVSGEVCAELGGALPRALYACHRLSIKAAACAQATYAGVRSSGPSAAALDRSASDSWRSRSSSCHHRRSRSPSCRPGRCRSPGGCIYVAGPPCAAPGKVRRALLDLRLERCKKRAKTARKGAEW